jgi:hypothetical protein
MADEQNIRVHDPASSAKEKDYDRSDVEHLMRVRDWRGWEELENWLRESGDDDRRLTPGEVRRLAEDVARARQRGAEFSTDPERLWQELRRP